MSANVDAEPRRWELARSQPTLGGELAVLAQADERATEVEDERPDRPGVLGRCRGDGG